MFPTLTRLQLSLFLGIASIIGVPVESIARELSGLAASPVAIEVEKRQGFLLKPDAHWPGLESVPWVFYAPTLPPYPGNEERWMIERFLASGIAVAGIDVGESFGSPEGRRIYSAFHAKLVADHGLAEKACLLARSRGGLMLYNWAAENPDKVAAIAGIYPVCDLRTYPGIEKASKAYGMSPERLQQLLPLHNPVNRLAPLAAAGVPIFHIHGTRTR